MIRWNEVTWYSRLAALILFAVIFPAIGFYVGTQYQMTTDYLKENEVTAAAPKLSGTYSKSAALTSTSSATWQPLDWIAYKTTSANTKGWNVMSNDKYHFSFKYPKDWNIQRNIDSANPNTHAADLHLTLGNNSERFDIEVQERAASSGITPEGMKSFGATREYVPYRSIADISSVQSSCGTNCISINFQKGTVFFNIDVVGVSTSTLDTIFDSLSLRLLPIGTSTNEDVIPVIAPDGRTLYYKGVTYEQALELFQQCQVSGGIEAFAGTFLTLKDGTPIKISDGGSMGDLMKAAASAKDKCGFSPGIGIE